MSPDFSRPEQCPNGYRIRIIPPDSDDAGTQTQTGITAPGRPAMALAGGARSENNKGKAAACYGPPGDPMRASLVPVPTQRRQTQWQSFGLACMIRLQTAKTSEKTNVGLGWSLGLLPWQPYPTGTYRVFGWSWLEVQSEFGWSRPTFGLFG